ncbi:TCTE1 [Acrasis kona]|uniref:TCTE1 n=1 Tax=Acrasis kona TaxID=1008807 RepID=A0AAW2YHV3_9EUKA
MTDLIFSQLEDISNDTFSEFNPYSLGDQSMLSPNGFGDDDINMYDQYSMDASDYQEYIVEDDYQTYTTDISHDQNNGSSTIPDEIKLKGINLQDHTGREIENNRLNRVKLRLFPHFFGLDFEDSLKGRSVSQFYPTDIISLVRQCDRVAIYFHFRTLLKARLWSDDLYTGSASDNQNKYYKDTPFSNTLFLMLELRDDSELQLVFKYINSNQQLGQTLRMVYAGWMYCASMCTASDVYVLSCAIQQDTQSDDRMYSKGFNVRAVMESTLQEAETFEREVIDNESPRSSEPEAIKKKIRFNDIEESNNSTATTSDASSIKILHSRNKTQPVYLWGKKSRQKLEKAQHPKAQSLPSLTTLDMNKVNLVIDPSKAKFVLPPTFYRIDEEIRNFASDLLNKGLLFHFQFTVGFCEALQILKTQQSKDRAKALLRKLTQHPVQLRDLHAVARYLLGQEGASNRKNSATAAPVASQRRTSIKRKKSEDSPLSATKRNSVQLTGSETDYNAMSEQFGRMNVNSEENCIIS